VKVKGASEVRVVLEGEGEGEESVFCGRNELSLRFREEFSAVSLALRASGSGPGQEQLAAEMSSSNRSEPRRSMWASRK